MNSNVLSVNEFSTSEKPEVAAISAEPEIRTTRKGITSASPNLVPGEPFTPAAIDAAKAIDAIRSVRRNSNIPLAARMIYVELADMGWTNGECWPSFSTLAGYVGLSRRHVIRMIALLEALGLIQSIDRHKRANLYRLLWHRDFKANTAQNRTKLVTLMSPDSESKKEFGSMHPSSGDMQVTGLVTPTSPEAPKLVTSASPRTNLPNQKERSSSSQSSGKNLAEPRSSEPSEEEETYIKNAFATKFQKWGIRMPLGVVPIGEVAAGLRSKGAPVEFVDHFLDRFLEDLREVPRKWSYVLNGFAMWLGTPALLEDLLQRKTVAEALKNAMLPMAEPEAPVKSEGPDERRHRDELTPVLPARIRKPKVECASCNDSGTIQTGDGDYVRCRCPLGSVVHEKYLEALNRAQSSENTSSPKLTTAGESKLGMKKNAKDELDRFVYRVIARRTAGAA